jgi:tRNA 2-selenouridine synthase SelU
MVTKNKKSQKKINLLKMSDIEKTKVLRELRQNLRQKIIEAKLWQSLVNTENIIINGETIQWKNIGLKGLTLNEF